MRTWRQAHPQATFAQMEEAVEAALAPLRARLLTDLCATATVAESGQVCADCGGPLQRRGQHTRRVTVRGGPHVRLCRPYPVCPACGAGVFPLDEQLGLLPPQVSPSLHEGIVRLLLDEIGYLPLSRDDASLFFRLVVRRYERASLVVTSNKSFLDWGEVFNDS